MVDSFPIPFGRYTLVERLAMGGMAELFLATAPGEHGFQKKVVIKRLLPHLAREPVYTAMFIDEAKLTAALVHPKIAQTHELGRSENDLFIAMEFVDGIDVLALLREHAWQRRRIPVEQAVWICHEVLDALDFAHNLTDERGESLGIVHRDISPSNVLLSRRGDVKLVDFGIARASAPGRHHRTKSGTLKGKYGYMSPEQVTEQPIDARSDLFSVGVVLAEMLCGRRLFAATAEIDVLLMVRDARLTRLDQFGGHIPPALDLILRRTLRKDPDERWSSAAELRDTLAEWLFQERHRVGPRNIAELVELFHDTAWRRRRESMAKAAAAVAAADQSALLPGAESLTPEPITPTSIGDQPSVEAQSRREHLAEALPAMDPRAGGVETGQINLPEQLRRRRASSTDGLPIIAIEQAAEPMFLDLGLELPDLGAPIATERVDETGPVHHDDGVDLDLADLTDPHDPARAAEGSLELGLDQGIDHGIELEAPSVRVMLNTPAAPAPPLSSVTFDGRGARGPSGGARGSGSSPALDAPRGYSNPQLEPGRGGSGSINLRGPASSPALEPPLARGPGRDGRSPSSPSIDLPRGSTSSAGLELPRTPPSSPSLELPRGPGSSPSIDPLLRGAGRNAPATSARGTGAAPPMTLDDDDDLGLGPAGPSGASGPTPTPAPPSTSQPMATRVPTRPQVSRRQTPTPAQPPYAARGSTPDLVPTSMSDLDPPVPPPSRGGPSPASGPTPAAPANARTSQPIMSAAARNRAMSTAPPAVDANAPTRRPTPRSSPPPGRAFLGDELDALADDIDAAVQQLQVPVAIDDDPSVRISMVEDTRPRTISHEDVDGTGGRRRPSRAPSSPEVPLSTRTGESGPVSDLGAPTARGDFAAIPPMTVMFRLAAASATGLLTAQVGGIRKEIFVRGGVPEYVTSNMASELLGNYLVARGALSSGELAMALAMMPHYGGKLGDTLVGLGLLKPLEVFRYLNHQVREKLIDVCTWTKGAYGWHEGLTNQRNAFPIDLNPFEVLGAGAMAARDDVIGAWLHQIGAARAVRVRPRPTIELERFELPGLTVLFDKIDGVRTVRDLVTEAIEPPHQRRIARLLRLLVHCEQVRTDG